MGYEWTDDDCLALADMLREMAISDPTPFLKVWSQESGLTPDPPHNGPARGLCQFEPATLKGLGYDVAADPTLDAFCALSVAGQMTWIQKYYMPAKKWCYTTAGVYLWTFLPAQVHLATSPIATVCARYGPYAWAYWSNHGFDTGNSGAIVVSDLVDAAVRSYDPRGMAIAGRVRALMV